ncbi:MAG: J domain-containing protein [Planctomycetia bacterium]
MNPHQVLGVAPDATLDEIRRAYREQVRRHHPDRGGDPASFIAVTKAYEELVARRTNGAASHPAADLDDREDLSELDDDAFDESFFKDRAARRRYRTGGFASAADQARYDAAYEKLKRELDDSLLRAQGRSYDRGADYRVFDLGALLRFTLSCALSAAMWTLFLGGGFGLLLAKTLLYFVLLTFVGGLGAVTAGADLRTGPVAYRMIVLFVTGVLIVAELIFFVYAAPP